MPLTGTGSVLGASIKASIDGLSDDDKKDRDKLFDEMGKTIIAHLIANGAGAVAVVSVAGVTPGGGVSGAGTGNLI
jgi:hypothetical protein